MARSHVTIREVADRAGVSHQTVSRVINNHERVSPETRAKVEAVMAELEFQPNAIARLLAQGRTSMLACLSPNLTDYTFSCLIEGAEQEAREHGYFLLTASAKDEEMFETLVNQLIDSRRTEGLIVINPYSDGRYKLLPNNVPVIFLGARPRDEQVDSVSLDDEAAGRLATQHLLDLGHRKIAHITGPLCEDCSQDRRVGYFWALQQAGIETDPEYIQEGDWTATSGYQIMQRWITQGSQISAVFTQNDRMAVGVIRAVRDSGMNVPRDISVIGFDDIPLASYFDPPLTTMRQDMHYSGGQAARLLIQRIENPSTHAQHLRFPAELVVRCSTTLLEGGASIEPCNDPVRSPALRK